MKLRLETLTPIHVASGEMNLGFLYEFTNDEYNIARYSFDDVITQVPVNKLLDLRFDQRNDKIKQKFIDTFKQHVDYSKLKPLYTMTYLGNEFDMDVSNQVKSLNRPIIPGSTIKGTIMTAILYHLLMHNKDKVRQAILNCRNPKTFEKDLFKMLYDDKFLEVFKLFSSCIICRDIIFEENSLLMCDDYRTNMSEDNMNFQKLECIDLGKVITDEIIIIDQHRKKVFKNEIKNESIYEELSKCLNIDAIFICLRNQYRSLILDDLAYFKDVEKQYFKDDKNDFEDRHKIIEFLEKLSFDSKDKCILRVGKGTNYFYKSITMYIKRNMPDIYNKKFDIFSPVKIQNNNTRGNKRPQPSPENMPKTRTYIDDYNSSYLLGFLQLEKCK